MSIEDVLRVADSGYGHALLSGVEPNGLVVREAIPVRRLFPDIVEVLGSPGYLVGFSAGDTLKVRGDHSFELVERGPNTCIQAFAAQPIQPNLIDELQNEVADMGGLVEAPAHRQMVVVTLPSAIGPERVTEIMTAWSSRAGRVEWQFGTPM